MYILNVENTWKNDGGRCQKLYALVKKIIELLIKIKLLFDEKSNICICIYMYIETVER